MYREELCKDYQSRYNGLFLGMTTYNRFGWIGSKYAGHHSLVVVHERIRRPSAAFIHHTNIILTPSVCLVFSSLAQCHTGKTFLIPVNFFIASL